MARIDTPPITRVPRDDEIDVFAISLRKVRKTNQDRYLLATINKRVNLISSNLDEEERLPVGDQRLMSAGHDCRRRRWRHRRRRGLTPRRSRR